VNDSLDRIKDFRPPDCNGNLVYSETSAKALYVDFQGFLLLNENRTVDRLIAEKGDCFLPETVCSSDGSQYLYEHVPGLTLGRGRQEKQGNLFNEMMEKAGISFEGRTVYDIGCNTGLRLYDALSKGASWAVGWDVPNAVTGAMSLLLAFGATRFELHGTNDPSEYDYYSDVPGRFAKTGNGILIMTGAFSNNEMPDNVRRIPWEFLFAVVKPGRADIDPDSLNETSRFGNAELIGKRRLSRGDNGLTVVFLRRYEGMDCA